MPTKEPIKGQMIHKGSILKAGAIDEKNFTVDAIVSGQTKDRDDEIILSSAWGNRIQYYREHPVLLSCHNSYGNLKQVIGSASNIEIGDANLKTRFEYFVNKGNDEADWGWFLVTKNLGAWSVGFNPFEWLNGKEGEPVRRTYTDVELYEISHVIIPSLREAIQNNVQLLADPNICKLAERIYGIYAVKGITASRKIFVPGTTQEPESKGPNKEAKTIVKTGRTLSQKTIDRLEKHYKNLTETAADIRLLLDENAGEDEGKSIDSPIGGQDNPQEDPDFMKLEAIKSLRTTKERNN